MYRVNKTRRMQACADSLSAWPAAIVKGRQGCAPLSHRRLVRFHRLRHGPTSAVASAPCSPILLFRRDKMGMCRFIGHRMAAKPEKTEFCSDPGAILVRISGSRQGRLVYNLPPDFP